MWNSYIYIEIVIRGRAGGTYIYTRSTSQSPRTAGILIKELNACSGIRNNPEG